MDLEDGRVKGVGVRGERWRGGAMEVLVEGDDGMVEE